MDPCAISIEMIPDRLEPVTLTEWTCSRLTPCLYICGYLLLKNKKINRNFQNPEIGNENNLVKIFSYLCSFPLCLQWFFNSAKLQSRNLRRNTSERTTAPNGNWLLFQFVSWWAPKTTHKKWRSRENLKLMTRKCLIFFLWLLANDANDPAGKAGPRGFLLFLVSVLWVTNRRRPPQSGRGILSRNYFSLAYIPSFTSFTSILQTGSQRTTLQRKTEVCVGLINFLLARVSGTVSLCLCGCVHHQCPASRSAGEIYVVLP